MVNHPGRSHTHIMKRSPVTIPCPSTSSDPLANGWADPSVGLGPGIRHEITEPMARAAHRVSTVLTEILVGSRPPVQCTRWFHPDEYIAFSQWLTAHPRLRVFSRRTRIHCPDPACPIVTVHWHTTAGQVTATAQITIDTRSANCRRVTMLVDTSN